MVAHSYDSFRQDLRKICETEGVIASGVDSRYTPHSFRVGGLSMMSNGSVAPAFIQKAGHHKKMESTNLYMNPSISTALRTSDLLCGNKEGGWNERLVDTKILLILSFILPRLRKKMILLLPTYSLLLSLLVLLDLRVLHDVDEVEL